MDDREYSAIRIMGYLKHWEWRSPNVKTWYYMKSTTDTIGFDEWKPDENFKQLQMVYKALDIEVTIPFGKHEKEKIAQHLPRFLKTACEAHKAGEDVMHGGWG
jgi:hypothetical protein